MVLAEESLGFATANNGYNRAEAEGFRSMPENYTIFIKEKVAYIVEEGTITKEEARHLDFQFEPQE